MAFIDIAVNLTDPMYQGIYHDKQRHEADLQRVLERAKAAGVHKMIVTGGSLEDSQKAIDLCREYDPSGGVLYCTVGVHPTRCNDFIDKAETPEAHLRALRELVEGNRDRVVAIGEIGLDFEREMFCVADTQKRFFEAHLDLVDALELPMFLHMRAAADAFCDILSRNRQKWERVGGVSHSFTGTAEELQKVIDLGLCIGLNGCSLKTDENLDVAAQVPEHLVMLETDAPWCDIRPTHASSSFVKTDIDCVKKPEKWEPARQVKGRNEPCNMVQVAEAVFGVRAARGRTTHDFNAFCNTVVSNTLRLFTKLKA
ncbi:unnamed protein product [Vitrella brassicaformis CCMP3155]|uniref:TatD related DNase n=1 Tax=Vitrella brassicaformis (strain CCMP3155) TaxID=1169540 RepID=A0A0G4H415_VITBC|nr:unnamed protein product [Vitrella brassicaformis CCMP3155]|eukprot:CEM38459.1 unnamed protein product [Vitrella brassicaformis CCMP3155]